MKKATLEKVQAGLGDYVRTSAKQPILIVHDGEPVAMLVGLARNGKRTRVKLRDVLKAAWTDYKKQDGIPHEQFWEQLAESRP